MQQRDRLVCAFVGSFKVGDQFKDWPLHVTLVPWFRTELASEALSIEFREALDGIKPFHVVMGDETKMGRGKTVNLVGCPTLFTEIEEQVRQTLKSHDSWLVDETTRRRRDYQPHVTAQKGARLYRGDVFICDTLYVVEQKGNHKEIVAKVGL